MCGICFEQFSVCILSRRQVLQDMGMLSAFTYTMHVPNLSQTEHIMAVLEETDVFSKKELDELAKKLRGKKYVEDVGHLPVKIVSKLCLYYFEQNLCGH